MEAQILHNANTEALQTRYDDLNSSITIGGTEEVLPSAVAGEVLGDHSNGLVEALPLGSSQLASRIMMAHPVEQENLNQQQAKNEAKDKKYIRLACLFVATTTIVVLALSLTLGTNNHRHHNNNESDAAANLRDNDSASSTVDGLNLPLPPMENLELLYESLPVGTKRWLYKRQSHQYRAWEWLLVHPSLPYFPEWRKKQIFAIVTFFYSFEGTKWPAPIQDRWLDVNTSECSWIWTESAVANYAEQSLTIFGPGTYSLGDYQSCNEEGEIQTLQLQHLYLPANARPIIPREIGLLTSLRIVGTIFSQINARLTDFVVPELINLPNLVKLNLHSSGITGTVPESIGQFTGLRHLLIGENQLIGTIPTEMARINTLEYVNLYANLFTGNIPTELGLLTSAKYLDLECNRLTGSVPSQLGLMKSVEDMWLGNNALGGSIPSELVLLTNLADFRLGNDLALQDSYLNDFSGTFPSELWRLSHLRWLFLPNLPSLHGGIPTGLVILKLTRLKLEGSPHLIGTIAEEMCSIEELKLDCSDELCGCHCQCATSGNGTSPDILWNESPSP